MILIHMCMFSSEEFLSRLVYQFVENVYVSTTKFRLIHNCVNSNSSPSLIRLGINVITVVQIFMVNLINNRHYMILLTA